MGGPQGASYSLPRKNFTPPLPIVKGEFGRGEIFLREGVRRPLETPIKEWPPIVYHCRRLFLNVKSLISINFCFHFNIYCCLFSREKTHKIWNFQFQVLIFSKEIARSTSTFIRFTNIADLSLLKNNREGQGQIDFSSGEVREIIKKGLNMNIYRDGNWGSMRHMMIKDG